MHGGVGGAVSEDDDGIGEPDGETGGDDGVGWMGQVISIYPYVPMSNPSPCPIGMDNNHPGLSLVLNNHVNCRVIRLRN